MIFTARQLEDLHRTNGHVTLPVGSRLTPLARDWTRQKRVEVRFSAEAESGTGDPPVSADVEKHGQVAHATRVSLGAALLWWCDGPCGPAKAAVAQQGRETSLKFIDLPAEPKHLVQVIRHLAREVKEQRIAGGILLVQSGAAAMVFANRCPSLRAVLGTCRESVEQGVRLVGANMLVIEYPYQTLSQMRNLLSQFVRAKRELPAEANRQLQELASCG